MSAVGVLEVMSIATCRSEVLSMTFSKFNDARIRDDDESSWAPPLRHRAINAPETHCSVFRREKTPDFVQTTCPKAGSAFS